MSFWSMSQAERLFYVCGTGRLATILCGLVILALLKRQQYKARNGDTRAARAVLLPVYEPLIILLVISISIEYAFLYLAHITNKNWELTTILLQFSMNQFSQTGLIAFFCSHSLSHDAQLRSIFFGFTSVIYGFICGGLIQTHKLVGLFAFNLGPVILTTLIWKKFIYRRRSIMPYIKFLTVYELLWVFYNIFSQAYYVEFMHFILLLCIALMEVPLCVMWYVVMWSDTYFWRTGAVKLRVRSTNIWRTARRLLGIKRKRSAGAMPLPLPSSVSTSLFDGDNSFAAAATRNNNDSRTTPFLASHHSPCPGTTEYAELSPISEQVDGTVFSRAGQYVPPPNRGSLQYVRRENDDEQYYSSDEESDTFEEEDPTSEDEFWNTCEREAMQRIQLLQRQQHQWELAKQQRHIRSWPDSTHSSNSPSLSAFNDRDRHQAPSPSTVHSDGTALLSAGNTGGRGTAANSPPLSPRGADGGSTPTLGFPASNNSSNPPSASVSRRKLPLETLFSGGSDELLSHDIQQLIEANKKRFIDFALLRMEDDQAIGYGGTSRVYKAFYRNYPVALKFFTRSSEDEELTSASIQAYAKETALAASFNHPSIVKFIGLCVRPPSMFLVMELCEAGSLFNLLPALKSHPAWCYSAILNFCIQACTSIDYLHQSGYVHRDIKSLNYMVNKQGFLKLTDFGLSRMFPQYQTPQHTSVNSTSRHVNIPSNENSHDAHPVFQPSPSYSYTSSHGFLPPRAPVNLLPLPPHLLTRRVGSRCWMSPEMIRGNPYSLSSDIYSLTMVFHEILTCSPPFESVPDELLTDVILQGIVPEIPEWTPPDFKTLLLSGWNRDPELRPTARQMLHRLKRMLKEHETVNRLNPFDPAIFFVEDPQELKAWLEDLHMKQLSPEEQALEHKYAECEKQLRTTKQERDDMARAAAHEAAEAAAAAASTSATMESATRSSFSIAVEDNPTAQQQQEQQQEMQRQQEQLQQHLLQQLQFQQQQYLEQHPPSEPHMLQQHQQEILQHLVAQQRQQLLQLQVLALQQQQQEHQQLQQECNSHWQHDLINSTFEPLPEEPKPLQ